MKKIIYIVLLIPLIIISYLIFKNVSKKPTIILNDNRKIEYGNTYYIHDFITIQNGTLNDEEIIYDTLGEKEITYTYKNDKKTYNDSFKVTIEDNANPIIMLNENYYTTINSEDNLTNKIMCADNYDKNPKCTIEGNYDLNTLGDYPLKFIAVDTNNNQTIQNFTLHVINKTKSTPTYTYFNDVITNYKTDKTKIGIDVSSWQEDIDFKKVKDAGAEFVMIRIGKQDGFNGEYILDKKFINNIENALNNNLDVGIYFYSYATTPEEAIKQANWVIDNLKKYEVKLPIAFDFESWSSFNKLNLNLLDITKVQEAFLDTIKNAGYDTARYGSKNYLTKVFLNTKHKTWLAHYNTSTDYQGDYFLWQICDDGKIDGIKGYVDIDILYK